MIRIVAHGGAGTLADELKPVAAEGIREATKIGYDLLSNGSSALDAVEATVEYLEENPNFNAGRGSVLTMDERIEMDAMIMDGKTLKIGGVMGMENYLHPFSISRAILEHDNHIFYAGVGAESVAKKYGFNQVPLEELITPRRSNQLKKFKEKVSGASEKFGTVGAVALDMYGNVASATSTGGVTGKKPGRIGDTPIPGAGTLANHEIAISATGTGEFIIRSMLASRISNHYQTSKNVYNSTVQSLIEMFKLVSGKAGVIVVTNTGEFTALHSTEDLTFAYNENNKIIDFMMVNNSKITVD